jgi:hypothetical protein
LKCHRKATAELRQRLSLGGLNRQTRSTG